MGSGFYRAYKESGGINQFIDTSGGLSGLSAAKSKRQQAADDERKRVLAAHRDSFTQKENFLNTAREEAYNMGFEPDQDGFYSDNQLATAAAAIPHSVSMVQSMVANMPESSRQDPMFRDIMAKTAQRNMDIKDGKTDITQGESLVMSFRALQAFDAYKAGYASRLTPSQINDITQRDLTASREAARAQVVAAQVQELEQTGGQAPDQIAVDNVEAQIEDKPGPRRRRTPATNKAAFVEGQREDRMDRREQIKAQLETLQNSATKEGGLSKGAVAQMQRLGEEYSSLEEPGVEEAAAIAEASPEATKIIEADQAAAAGPPPKTPTQATAQAGKAVKENRPLSDPQAQGVIEDATSGNKRPSFWRTGTGRVVLTRSLQSMGMLKSENLSMDELARLSQYHATGEQYDSEYLKILGNTSKNNTAAAKQGKDTLDGQRKREYENVNSIINSLKGNKVLVDSIGEERIGTIEANAKTIYENPKNYTFLLNALQRSSQFIDPSTLPEGSPLREKNENYMHRMVASLSSIFAARNLDMRAGGGTGMDMNLRTYLANGAAGDIETFWGVFGEDDTAAREVINSLMSASEWEELKGAMNDEARSAPSFYGVNTGE